MKKEEQNKLLKDRIQMLRRMMHECVSPIEQRQYAELIKDTERLL